MAIGWTVTETKARFSELLDRATKTGPQIVTRNGRAVAVVVSAAEWDRRTRRSGNLAEFLAVSPLRGSGLKVRRKCSLAASVLKEEGDPFRTREAWDADAS